MSAALLLVLACGQPRLGDPLAPAQTEVDATLASKRVAEGEPLEVTVSVRWAEGWTPDLAGATPLAEGLTATLVEERSVDAERATSTQVWALAGPPGSYAIAPLAVSFTGPGDQERTLRSPALFGDIGVDGPTSELAGMSLAPVPEPWPTWPIPVAAGLLLLGGGLLWWRRRGQAEPVAPPVPPDVAALAAWQALQADGSLDDHARAVALSGLFRAYLEAVLPIAATTATSREILESLDLSHSLQQRTRRLLTATDLIKFARKGGGAELFDGLGDDLVAVVDATRPVPDPAEDAEAP